MPVLNVFVFIVMYINDNKPWIKTNQLLSFKIAPVLVHPRRSVLLLVAIAVSHGVLLII